jgi:hypothetical protein
VLLFMYGRYSHPTPPTGHATPTGLWPVDTVWRENGKTGDIVLDKPLLSVHVLVWALQQYANESSILSLCNGTCTSIPPSLPPSLECAAIRINELRLMVWAEYATAHPHKQAKQTAIGSYYTLAAISSITPNRAPHLHGKYGYLLSRYYLWRIMPMNRNAPRRITYQSCSRCKVVKEWEHPHHINWFAFRGGIFLELFKLCLKENNTSIWRFQNRSLPGRVLLRAGRSKQSHHYSMPVSRPASVAGG